MHTTDLCKSGSGASAPQHLDERSPMWLFIAFLAVPLIEIALFLQIGGLIGFWPTIGTVILTAILGTWLVR